MPQNSLHLLILVHDIGDGVAQDAGILEEHIVALIHHRPIALGTAQHLCRKRHQALLGICQAPHRNLNFLVFIGSRHRGAAHAGGFQHAAIKGSHRRVGTLPGHLIPGYSADVDVLLLPHQGKVNFGHRKKQRLRRRASSERQRGQTQKSEYKCSNPF